MHRLTVYSFYTLDFGVLLFTSAREARKARRYARNRDYHPSPIEEHTIEFRPTRLTAAE